MREVKRRCESFVFSCLADNVKNSGQYFWLIFMYAQMVRCSYSGQSPH